MKDNELQTSVPALAGRKTQGGIKVDAFYFLKFTTLRRDYIAITESKSPKNKLENEYILQAG